MATRSPSTRYDAALMLSNRMRFSAAVSLATWAARPDARRLVVLLRRHVFRVEPVQRLEELPALDGRDEIFDDVPARHRRLLCHQVHWSSAQSSVASR